MNKLFGWLAVLLLFLPFTLAQTINYSVSEQIVGNKAFVMHDINLLSAGTNIELEIPDDAKDLALQINGKDAKPNVSNKILQVLLDDLSRKIEVTYVSGINTETPDEFLTDLKMPADVKNLDVKVALPEGAMLRKPLSEGGSIFPKPAKVETDGLQIYITWNAKNLTKGDHFGAFVLYKSKTLISSAWYVVGALVVVVIILLIRRKRKEKTQKARKHAESKPSKHKHEDIESHLKEDEKQIVNVLKQRDGQCEQGTLRVVTGIPKASLSRLLMELEARKVIYKEKRGKKNLIFLKS